MARVRGLTKADFEIALTALIATTVVTFPTGEVPEYPIIRLLAVSLLALTLIRRSAVINEVGRDGYLLEGTTQLLDLFTYITILYLFFNLSIRISEAQSVPLSPQLVFLSITPVATLGLLLVQQYALNDALRGAEEQFATKSDEHHGEFIGLVLMNIAVFVGKRRQMFHRESRQSRLVEYYPEFVMQGADSLYQKFIFYIVSAFVLLTFILLFATGSTVFGVPLYMSIIFLISVMLTVGLVDLWYTLYGVIGAGDRNGFLHFIVVAVTFLFIGKMILSL